MIDSQSIFVGGRILSAGGFCRQLFGDGMGFRDKSIGKAGKWGGPMLLE